MCIVQPKCMLLLDWLRRFFLLFFELTGLFFFNLIIALSSAFNNTGLNGLNIWLEKPDKLAKPIDLKAHWVWVWGRQDNISYLDDQRLILLHSQNNISFLLLPDSSMSRYQEARASRWFHCVLSTYPLPGAPVDAILGGVFLYLPLM